MNKLRSGIKGSATTPSEFEGREVRFLKSLKTPAGVQRFIDSIPYHHAGTAWSPHKVMRERTAHCLEGAIFAAAALRVLGFPPLLWDLEAHRDDDHVLAVFQKDGHWGAIAKSNFSGLRYREPVYRNLRELAMSYFNDYFNLAGHRSLRSYASRPINLARFDKRHWMSSDESLWYIAEHIVTVPHTRLLTRKMENMLTVVDHRGKQAGFHGRLEPGVHSRITKTC